MNYHRALFCFIKLFVVIFLITIFLPLNLLAAPPANDDCAAAITLPSSTTCTNVQYTIQDATASAGIPVGCASAGTLYDVWFKFTATQTSHTITVSSLGAGITNPELQLFSGTCGSLTSLVCGTTFVTGSGLTVGNVYYFRFSNIGAAIPANGLFNICITNSGTPPINDECAGAISLTSNTSCNNISYSMRYATASSGIPVGCAAGGTHYDVWFSFTAAATSQTVTISNLGNSITSSDLQLFSGTCGSLTSVACGTTTLTATVCPVRERAWRPDPNAAQTIGDRLERRESSLAPGARSDSRPGGTRAGVSRVSRTARDRTHRFSLCGSGHR